MSEIVLTAFVYLTVVTLTVTLFSVGIAVVQLIEDTPMVRKKIWDLKNKGILKA